MEGKHRDFPKLKILRVCRSSNPVFNFWQKVYYFLRQFQKEWPFKKVILKDVWNSFTAVSKRNFTANSFKLFQLKLHQFKRMIFQEGYSKWLFDTVLQQFQKNDIFKNVILKDCSKQSKFWKQVQSEWFSPRRSFPERLQHFIWNDILGRLYALPSKLLFQTVKS